MNRAWDRFDDLDAKATLAAAEDTLVARRAAEVDDLPLACHWADLHAADLRRSLRVVGPGAGRTGWSRSAVTAPVGPGAVPARASRSPDAPTPVHLGGAGRRPGPAPPPPRTWAILLAGTASSGWSAGSRRPPRRLDRHQVGPIVDAAVADAIAGESPAGSPSSPRPSGSSRPTRRPRRPPPGRATPPLAVGCGRIDDHGLRTVTPAEADQQSSSTPWSTRSPTPWTATAT